MIALVISIMPAALILSALLTLCARRHALRRNRLDVPNSRSSHTVPTPRGGGIAIVSVFLSAVLALLGARVLAPKLGAALLVGGAAMACVGYLDDRRPLPAGWRFVVHLGAAMLAVYLVGGVPERSLQLWYLHGEWTGRVLAVIAVVWVSNFFNFMDGIDGIAASEAIFVSAAGAWLAAQHGVGGGPLLALLSLAAASLGFLFLNWPPARIFMGDVGSGFIGYVIAVTGLASSQASPLPIEIWPILAGVFLIDSTVTLVRRAARGDRWFEPHRTHAYQRLARVWRGHLPVTVATAAINLGWLLPWAWLAADAPARAAYYAAAALLPMALLVLWAGAGRADV